MAARAIDLIAEASAKNGTQIGLPLMTHIAMSNVNFLGYRQNENDKFYKVFLAFDQEEVGEIFWEAKTLDIHDIQEAWISVFIKKIAFNSSDRYVYSKIADFIHKTAYLTLSGRCIYNLENDPSMKYILRDYLDLKENPKTPNEHFCIVKNKDGMDTPAYDVTKEQFDSLIGKTRLEASIMLCKWFADAGINIAGDKYN